MFLDTINVRKKENILSFTVKKSFYDITAIHIARVKKFMTLFTVRFDEIIPINPPDRRVFMGFSYRQCLIESINGLHAAGQFFPVADGISAAADTTAAVM